MKTIILFILIFMVSCKEEETRMCIECKETTGTGSIEYFCGFKSECEDYRQALLRNGLYVTGYRYSCEYK